MSLPSALLFDLDGTLVHSDPLHFGAFRTLFAEFGIDLDWEDYRSTIGGKMNREIFAHFLPGREELHPSLGDRKEAMFRESLAETLEPTPGALDLIAWAGGQGVAVAVVTNAPRANAEVMLKAAGLGEMFRIVVTSEDVSAGKPDPAPYLLASERLGAAAETAIAFEDSLPGVMSAAGAGAFVFGMTSAHDAASLRHVGARATIQDFRDPALWGYIGTEGDSRQ
jgi:HAD superfamily hydrolase (TIGR01509 family)